MIELNSYNRTSILTLNIILKWMNEILNSIRSSFDFIENFMIAINLGSIFRNEKLWNGKKKNTLYTCDAYKKIVMQIKIVYP